jgi:prolyl oligopeptidase
MIIRIEKEAGHGSGTPVSKIIEQYADKFGFALFNMGFSDLPVPLVPKQLLQDVNT